MRVVLGLCLNLVPLTSCTTTFNILTLLCIGSASFVHPIFNLYTPLFLSLHTPPLNSAHPHFFIPVHPLFLNLCTPIFTSYTSIITNLAPLPYLCHVLLCAPPFLLSRTPVLILCCEYPWYLLTSHPCHTCFMFTWCTLTFTSRTSPAYCMHLPYLITRTPYVFVSHFWACVYALLVAPPTLLMHPTIFFLLLSFFLLIFFLFLKKRKWKYFKLWKITKK